MPHTAKLCLSVVLKKFWGYSLIFLIFCQKMTISEKGVAIPVENLDLFKQLSLIKPLKRDKY